ncbi:SRPBCC domain-containing protein [uncultured Chitinophaga sp.]|uniref:SRPBCC family protein n=1 Tax=uncultured Chitinophaga sp. TaxID=339340 RepID=UPI00261E31FB|nr:SRPBCC domain-containing protein [uncultured Chitinophaga sp.]
METLEYKIDINAPKEKVWNTMLQLDTYKQWTDVSWPGSTYVGEWKEGQAIRFLGGEDQGGTYAELHEVRPYERIHAVHSAVIAPDGALDKDSEMAKGWVGSTESYTFTEKDGKTEIKVHIKTNPAWASMFDEGWPSALEKLKEICER